MKELRDIKLDLLMGNQNPIVDLFNQITKDIKIINCEVYHKEGIEFIYFSGDKWIFYQDCNNEEFWCNYDIYWSLFESNFDLEYDDIQEVTKFLVEEALKREVNTTIRCKTNNCIPVEEVLKRDLGTPEADPLAGFFHVEDALLSAREWLEPLKKELGTPLTTLNNVFALEVEEALKKEIAAPDKMTAMVNGLVERSIKKIKNI